VPQYRNIAYKEARTEEDKPREEDNAYIINDLRKAGEVSRICRH